MRLTDQYFFARAESIHRLFVADFTDQQPQIYQRLNQAHPNLNSDSFLGWRLGWGSKGVR
jgi:hypothetical protein